MIDSHDNKEKKKKEGEKGNVEEKTKLKFKINEVA